MPPNSDRSANQAAIEFAVRELNQLFAALSAVETKAATILGFMAVLIALLLRTSWGLASLWAFIPAGFTAISVLRTWSSGDIKLGPDPLAFYQEHATEDSATVDRWVLVELGKTLTTNRVVVGKATRQLLIAFAGALVTVFAAIGVYLVRGG